MARKKKLTPNQDKYKELRNRLRRKLRDLKKRGYIPNKSSILEAWVYDDIPKRVTKSMLQALQGLVQGDTLYGFTHYYSALKDKYISGTERRAEERSEAARKAWETRRRKARERDKFWEEFDDYYEPDEYWESLPYEEELILDKIKEMIETWEPDPKWSPAFAELKRQDRNLLKSVFDGAINELGKIQVAHNIKGKSEELLQYVNDILYASGDKYKSSGRDGVMLRIQQVRDILYGRASTVRESMDITDLAEQFNESE